MRALIVVENAARWALHVRGAEVVSAREYLTDPRFAESRRVRVLNMCRSYSYQSAGYYVSLLASARGHRALPSVDTIQDLGLSPLVRIASQDLDALMQRALRHLRSRRFELSIYFGRNLAHRYDSLGNALFSAFPAPFLRAQFEKERDGRWRLQAVGVIATSEIPDSHRSFVIQRVEEELSSPRRRTARREARYDLAILAGPEIELAPSNEKALRAFERAGRELDIDVVRIGRQDYGRLGEFDALFVRETTAVNHFTYRFARRAAAIGLVVIDDPESIVRCTNKVYQAELFAQEGIPCPPTMLVHASNVEEVVKRVGLPCVLKQPDSAFSKGVVKIEREAELYLELERLLDESDMVIAQSFMPSPFDWRIGVLGGEALWAARYYMAKGHWQIADARAERVRFGRVEALPVSEAPARAVKLALRATEPIGDGLYGVDVKQLGSQFVVMEVNDNPNLDAGYEDRVLGAELYRAVMRHFRAKLDLRAEGRNHA